MLRDADGIRRETKGFRHQRAASLVDDVDLLLADLCKGWGFRSAAVDDVLRIDESLTADAFATAILAAEGWPEPELEWEWRSQLKRIFVARYGNEVSASDYDRRGQD